LKSKKSLYISHCGCIVTPCSMLLSLEKMQASTSTRTMPQNWCPRTSIPPHPHSTSPFHIPVPHHRSTSPLPICTCSFWTDRISGAGQTLCVNRCEAQRPPDLSTTDPNVTSPSGRRRLGDTIYFQYAQSYSHERKVVPASGTGDKYCNITGTVHSCTYHSSAR
jgi:hypothetical protein